MITQRKGLGCGCQANCNRGIADPPVIPYYLSAPTLDTKNTPTYEWDHFTEQFNLDPDESKLVAQVSNLNDPRSSSVTSNSSAAAAAVSNVFNVRVTDYEVPIQAQKSFLVPSVECTNISPAETSSSFNLSNNQTHASSSFGVSSNQAHASSPFDFSGTATHVSSSFDNSSPLAHSGTSWLYGNMNLQTETLHGDRTESSFVCPHCGTLCQHGGENCPYCNPPPLVHDAQVSVDVTAGQTHGNVSTRFLYGGPSPHVNMSDNSSSNLPSNSFLPTWYEHAPKIPGSLRRSASDPTLCNTHFHTSVQLAGDREGIMVDTGACDNLTGDQWVQRQTRIAALHGRSSDFKKLLNAIPVNGVGSGQSHATQEATVPICLDCEDSKFISPVVPDSMIPALWGIKSQRRRKAIIDTGGNAVILPGKGNVKMVLPPGSQVVYCENALSGHMMVPCSDWLHGKNKKSSVSHLWTMYHSAAPTDAEAALAAQQ